MKSELLFALLLEFLSIANCLVLPNDTLYDAADMAEGKEVCMVDLGCFGTKGDFYHILHRPFSVLPQDRVTINTRCLLYTRTHPKESEQLIYNKPATFKESTVDPSIPTKFILHGYMDSELYGPWMLKMKDELLMHGEYNVIIVDWSGGNRGPYFQATANSRVVGAEVALILKGLQKHLGVKMEDCHLIGHSLGAHIAGYAGKRVPGVGRITGLDPAEPYFQNMPAVTRIDNKDATFVDIIHSDATNIRFIGFGMSQMVGDVDFFPNNGQKQPGCSLSRLKTFITEGLNEGLRRFASCNHQRALDFMHYTINYKKVLPVAYECVSWEKFLEGNCVDCGPNMTRCGIMGMRANEYKHNPNATHRAFYLKTSAKSPFWLYHYQVGIKLYKPQSSVKDVKGTISVELVGSKNNFVAKVQEKAIDLFHGSRYQYLVTTDTDLGEIQSVSFTWYLSSMNPLHIVFKPVIYVEYVTVVPMNVIEKSPRNMTGRIFCGNPESPIKPKTTSVFYKQSSCHTYYSEGVTLW